MFLLSTYTVVLPRSDLYLLRKVPVAPSVRTLPQVVGFRKGTHEKVSQLGPLSPVPTEFDGSLFRLVRQSRTEVKRT